MYHHSKTNIRSISAVSIIHWRVVSTEESRSSTGSSEPCISGMNNICQIDGCADILNLTIAFSSDLKVIYPGSGFKEIEHLGPASSLPQVRISSPRLCFLL